MNLTSVKKIVCSWTNLQLFACVLLYVLHIYLIRVFPLLLVPHLPLKMSSKIQEKDVGKGDRGKQIFRYIRSPFSELSSKNTSTPNDDSTA